MSRWSPASRGRSAKTLATPIGGSINAQGSFIMRADKVGRDTMLSQIVQMVASAQRSRAPIQGLADKVAGIFVPLVILIAVVAFIAWSLFGPAPAMAYALIEIGRASCRERV